VNQEPSQNNKKFGGKDFTEIPRRNKEIKLEAMALTTYSLLQSVPKANTIEESCDAMKTTKIQEK